MKKINHAFTLVELIVVISIITLMTSSGVVYFIDFVRSQELDQRVDNIHDYLKNYDTQIKKNTIYDYSINISVTDNSIGYQVDTNIFDLLNPQTISYNYQNHAAEISRSGSGVIEIYKGIKLFNRSNITSLGRSFTLDNQNHYTIAGTEGGITLNNIDIRYYSPQNYDGAIENNLELIEINTLADQTGSSINTLIITNINGKKALLADGIPINQAALIFEYSGQQSSIIISS